MENKKQCIDQLLLNPIKINVCNNIVERYGYIGRSSQIAFSATRLVWDTIAAGLLFLSANPIMYELPLVPEVLQVTMSLLSMKGFDNIKKCSIPDDKLESLNYFIISKIYYDIKKIIKNSDLLKNELYVISLKQLIRNYYYNLSKLLEYPQTNNNIIKIKKIALSLNKLVEEYIDKEDINNYYSNRIKGVDINNKSINIKVSNFTQIKNEIKDYLELLKSGMNEDDLYLLLPSIIQTFKVDSVFNGLCKLLLLDKTQKTLPSYHSDYEYILFQFRSKESSSSEIEQKTRLTFTQNIKRIVSSIQWKKCAIIAIKLGSLYLINKVKESALLPAGVLLFKTEIAGVLNEIYNIYHIYKRIGSELFYYKLFEILAEKKDNSPFIEFQIGFYLTQFIHLKSLFRCIRENVNKSNFTRKYFKNTLIDRTSKYLLLDKETDFRESAGCDIVGKQHCQDDEGESIEFGEGVCHFQEFSVCLYPFRFSLSKSDLEQFVSFVTSHKNKVPIGKILSSVCNNSFILGILYYCFNLKIGNRYKEKEMISIFKLTPTFITRMKGMLSSKKAVVNCSINILARIYIGQYLLDNANIKVNLLNIILQDNANLLSNNLNKPNLLELKQVLNSSMEKYNLNNEYTIELKSKKGLIGGSKLILSIGKHTKDNSEIYNSKNRDEGSDMDSESDIEEDSDNSSSSSSNISSISYSNISSEDTDTDSNEDEDTDTDSNEDEDTDTDSNEDEDTDTDSNEDNNNNIEKDYYLNGSSSVMFTIDIISDSLTNLLLNNHKLKEIVKEYNTEKQKLEDEVTIDLVDETDSPIRTLDNEIEYIDNDLNYKNNVKKMIKNIFLPIENNFMKKMGRLFSRKIQFYKKSIINIIRDEITMTDRGHINTKLCSKQLYIYTHFRKIEALVDKIPILKDILRKAYLTIMILENIFLFKGSPLSISYFFNEMEIGLQSKSESYQQYVYYKNYIETLDFNVLQSIFYLEIFQKYGEHSSDFIKKEWIDINKNILKPYILINTFYDNEISNITQINKELNITSTDLSKIVLQVKKTEQNSIFSLQFNTKYKLVYFNKVLMLKWLQELPNSILISKWIKKIKRNTILLDNYIVYGQIIDYFNQEQNFDNEINPNHLKKLFLLNIIRFNPLIDLFK